MMLSKINLGQLLDKFSKYMQANELKNRLDLQSTTFPLYFNVWAFYIINYFLFNNDAYKQMN